MAVNLLFKYFDPLMMITPKKQLLLKCKELLHAKDPLRKKKTQPVWFNKRICIVGMDRNIKGYILYWCVNYNS